MDKMFLKQSACIIATLIMLTLLGCSCSCCKSQSDRLDDSATMALDSFRQCRYIALTKGVGMSGRRSEQYDYANQLSRHATVEQLAEIANTDTSRISRLWAFRILLKKADKQVLDVLKQALNDTTYVQLMSGCERFIELYNRAAIYVYNYDYEKLKLSDQLRFSADSLIFFGYMKKYGFDDVVFVNFKPHKIYYATIEEEADKGNEAILPLLAKYQNLNDRQRINKLLKASLKENGEMTYSCREAIRTWSDPAFEWYAKTVCKTAVKKQDYYIDDYLPLLWAYPATWSFQILEDILSEKKDLASDNEFTCNKEQTLDFLAEQVRTQPPHPLFRPLYDKYLMKKD